MNKGLWGERLFDIFDKKHTSRIDFIEFIQGMANCCKCDQEQKIKMLFNLYDIDKDGFIEKKEMTMMLYNYPKSEIKNIIEDVAPDKGMKLKSLRETSMLFENIILNNNNSNSQVNLNPKSQLILPIDPATNAETKHNKNKSPASITIPSKEANKILIEEDIPNEKLYALDTKVMQRCITSNLVEDYDKNVPLISIIDIDDVTKKIEPDMKSMNNISTAKQVNPAITTNLLQTIPNTINTNNNGAMSLSIPSNKNQMITEVNSSAKASLNLSIPKSNIKQKDQSFLIATNVSGRVKEYTSFLFRNFEGASARGKISFDEFKDWLSEHPIFLKIFDDSFHKDLWAIDDSLPIASITNAKCEYPLRYQKKKNDITGELFKKGQKSNAWKTRYFELKEHFLFYYKAKKDNFPKGIYFLEGCLIEETKDYKMTKKYGFRISFKSDSYKTHALYCKTEAQFNQWMNFLKYFKPSSIFERYSFTEKIGTGKFSIVYRCIDKSTNREYAIKIIDQTSLKDDAKEFVLMEINIMKILDHPHVIKLHDTIETRTHYYIIEDIVNDGDLFDYIVNKEFLEEIEASTVIYQLIKAFIYIHNAGIIHRDVKPENILITLGDDKMIKDIKIIDFGFAKLIQPGQILKEACGTPNYVAPEVITGQGYDKLADIWSIGIIMYLMLRGQLPFDAQDIGTILWKTKKGEININDRHWNNISLEGKDLMMKFLKREPKERIELNEALNHPWIKQRNIILPSYVGKNQKGLDFSPESSLLEWDLNSKKLDKLHNS